MNVRTTVRQTFRNEDEGRLRMPWRIGLGLVIFSVGTLVVSGLLVSLLSLAGLDRFVLDEFTGINNTMNAFVLAITVVVVLWPIGRYLDRRHLVDYGLGIDRDWWADLGFGLLLGAALQTAIFLVGWSAGWFRVTGTIVADGPFLPALAILALFFIVVSIGEELLLRGWLLTNLAEGLRLLGERVAVGLAVLCSSLLFGLIHLPNPGATLVTVALVTVGGAFLAIGYVLTGQLGIPIGIHITWNFTQASVFGLPVSGIDIPVTIVAVDAGGPGWLTGGAFGPESGALSVAALVAGSVAICWWAMRREGQLSIHPNLSIPGLRGAGREPATPEGE